MDTSTSLDRLEIKGEMSIFTASEIRLRLLEAIAAGNELEVDLSAVTEIDSAGMQLMVAAKHEAAARNLLLHFTGHSPAVFEVLELCRLSSPLGDPLLISSHS